MPVSLTEKIYFSVLTLLTYELKTDFFNLQEQLKIPETREAEQERADEKDSKEEKSDEMLLETLETRLNCFLRNFATSACPNAAKGIFVNLDGAKGFLKGH